MNTKTVIVSIAVTLAALIVYDMFVKKAILKSSFESEFEDEE